MQDKRDFLFDILPKNSICAEIGVWRGDFSQEILDNLNPKELYLIDPWKYEPAYNCSWYGGVEAKNQKDMNKIRDKVFEKFRLINKVKIFWTTSLIASTNFADNYLDFVYIDANHLYHSVKQDLEIFYPKVKDNGLITGDDYGITGWWGNGVQEAVDEFIEKNNLKLIIKNNQFIIKKEI
jgi:hypothetical protein